MKQAFLVQGQVVRSYNDGSFYVERRSARRPTDWVSQDSYPRASLEVYPAYSMCCCVGLTMCVSANSKRHTRKELIQAQELGEMIAIGYNRYINKWDEKDSEVSLWGTTSCYGIRYI
jgi:hypothetical protein